MTRRQRIAIAAGIALLAVVAIADARPGGGQSYRGGGGHYSGGGGHSSSGGGGGGGGAIFELIYWTIRLVIYYPMISIPIIIGIVIWVAWSAHQQNKNKDWDSGPPVPLRHSVDASALRRGDPDFSQAVFEDFAFRLFSAAQRARSPAANLATLGPYLTERARAQLAARQPANEPVTAVVVGAMRFTRVDVPPPPNAAADGLDVLNSAPPQRPRARIYLEFEANVSTKSQTSYSVEGWLLGRDASAVSKPPGVSRTFPCPNCGAPWQSSRTGTQVCASCGQAVDNGRFDWVVEDIEVRSEQFGPPTLTDDVPERGTDLPTYRQQTFDEKWQELANDDPQLTQESVAARLALIYRELNAGWSNNKLEPVRGLVSDGLYDYLQYWVEAYRAQGLRNQLTDMRITKVEFAKLVRDRFYDALTIRFWATGKDFVVRTDTGKILRGSKQYERPYSEYWTLIRSTNAAGPAHADPTCGNCGAPLKITMAGECEHCGAHVTAGEFDWVLSKIEQDDSYRG